VGEHVDQPAEGGDAEHGADERPERRPLELLLENDEQRRRGEDGDEGRRATEPPPLARQGDAVLVDPATHSAMIRGINYAI
jgi:hypothetical protein